MKNPTRILLAAALALGTALPVYAGNRHDGVWERLDRQQSRIERGVESGDLTRWEAKRLRREHREIHRLAHELGEDGRLDRHDRRILERRLDTASQNIRDLRHNDRDRHARHDDRRYDTRQYDFDDRRRGTLVWQDGNNGWPPRYKQLDW